MMSRERIIATLEHREPDRLAIDFAGTDCSSVHINAYDKLRKYMSIEPRPIRAACLTQITATGMEPARLKKEFGDDIAFWGGGVSTQGVLDKGTVQEIKDEVKRNVDTFSPGGGFVFTQAHNIQYNVPPENIVAAYQVANEA